MAVGFDADAETEQPARTPHRQGDVSRIDEERAQKAAQAYLDGESLDAIEKLVGVSRRPLKEILRSQGVKLRGPGRQRSSSEICGNCGRRGAKMRIKGDGEEFMVHGYCYEEARQALAALSR